MASGEAWQAGIDQYNRHHSEVEGQKDADRQAQRNQLGALYLNAINTPLPKPDDPAYKEALNRRETLMRSMVALNDPAQHASFADRLHGLIFGKHEPPPPPQSSANTPTPVPPAPQTAEASGNAPQPTPMHPFAPSPVLAPIQQGIDSLGEQIKKAQQSRVQAAAAAQPGIEKPAALDTPTPVSSQAPQVPQSDLTAVNARIHANQGKAAGPKRLLKKIGEHASAFAHPNPPKPGVDFGELAAAYQAPGDHKIDDAVALDAAKTKEAIRQIDADPNLSAEDKAAAHRHLYGLSDKKEVPTKYFNQILTTKDDAGKEHYYRLAMEEGANPEEVNFQGQQVLPKGGHKGLKFEPSTGEVINQDTGKRYSIANVGDRDTPPEVKQIFIDSKSMMDQKQKNALALASQRGLSFVKSVVDPNNPEREIFMTGAEAIRSGASAPGSIAYQTDKAITKYMTSGQGATNINYFNTATDHLKLLKEVGDALHNGQYQIANKYANEFAAATGNPAPSNFDAVKTAVAGELSKTFKGTGATDQEIGEINTTINRAQSPEQIQGAIDWYTRLMEGKINALKGQYEAGKSGRPNFPSSSSGPKEGETKKNSHGDTVKFHDGRWGPA